MQSDVAPTEQDRHEPPNAERRTERRTPNAKRQTPNASPLHRSRREARDDLFLGEQIECDCRDHGQADEGQNFTPIGAVLALKLHDA
jgi:hypothetical protein